MFFAGYFFFSGTQQSGLASGSAFAADLGADDCLGLGVVFHRFHPRPVSFYTLRFVAGAAEAGFFPGMILYLKQWFPANAAAAGAVAWRS